MKNEASKKAMEILNEDEKMALTLKHIDQKSSWQGGEILKKSHYKYLEIASRAEFFFKKFTVHFGIYDNIIPNEVSIHPAVKLYLKLVIKNRMNPTKTRPIIREKFDKWRFQYWREKLIKKELLKFQASSNPHEQYFYHLIKDFDRWNNYRILPGPFQEPHAFKRRQKNRHKKILNLTIQTGHAIADYLEYTFGALPQMSDSQVLWTYVCPNLYSQEYRIIRIMDNPEAIEAFTNRFIYVFKNKDNVVKFVAAVRDYVQKQKSEILGRVKMGQKFWPFFREHTKKAINYNQIEKVVPDRKQFQYVVPDETSQDRKTARKYAKLLEEKYFKTVYYDTENNVYLLKDL